MTTLVLWPLDEQEESTYKAIQLMARIAEADYMGLYDRLEFWRSRSLASGPYEELTAESVAQARIPIGAADDPGTSVVGPSAFIVGKTLELLIDESDEVVITFTGSDPLTRGEAAAQINAQGQSKVTAYVTSGGALVLESTKAGTSAFLRVAGGDAAPLLGLLIGSMAYGRNARSVLSGGSDTYVFLDGFGSDDYFYKTRFRNAATGSVSEYSVAVTSSGSRIGVSPASLATGRMTLVQVNGKPLLNHEVRIHAEFNGTLVEDSVLAGSDLIQSTNAEGKVEFVLLKGQKVSVAIPGTNMYRKITVPDRDIFNLWDPDIADEDIFRVQVPDIIAAERRSL